MSSDLPVDARTVHAWKDECHLTCSAESLGLDLPDEDPQIMGCPARIPSFTVRADIYKIGTSKVMINQTRTNSWPFIPFPGFVTSSRSSRWFFSLANLLVSDMGPVRYAGWWKERKVGDEGYVETQASRWAAKRQR